MITGEYGLRLLIFVVLCGWGFFMHDEIDRLVTNLVDWVIKDIKKLIKELLNDYYN